ncbi:hypothetical protein G7017_08030 [Pseudomonas fulva]|uniref:hypothetical protein n=1 Tax=Pseudomonas TaxID=286 RepID=UPI0015E37B65|nr:hypothetical protein [Pseudomonas fulva]MBA1220845.1 hypothetical protein [Pseudomonas fulva]MBN4168144.1 hypothetical protein [Pseudomonas fulva]
MDLSTMLAEANISTVAIVDDDLSMELSVHDLLAVDGDLEALLGDPHDPDTQQYRELLIAHNYDFDGLPDRASPLADERVRNAAPNRLREAAESVLNTRHDNAAPVRRLQDLLQGAGVAPDNIHTYSKPEMPPEHQYDLLIVDYYLVDNSAEKTIPFVKTVLDAHVGRPHPLQVVLMSTYEAEIKQKFSTFRPELGVSSSRMRVMSKPVTDDYLTHWKLALSQLANDRSYIGALEGFIRNTGVSIKRAAEQQAEHLWELDLQAMDILHETACRDNDDYSRYVQECISRHLLTQIEGQAAMRGSISTLEALLQRHRTENVIPPVAEIGDSRAAIRSLMRSMEWRGGGAPTLTPYPAQGDNLDKAKWVKKNLRFGMVLKDSLGKEWLNLTQACDLAQAKDHALETTSLLLICGYRTHPSTGAAENGGLVQMNSAMTDDDAEVLGWNMRYVRTPSIQEFGLAFGDHWQVIGELRLDLTQSIAEQYASRAARVGLQRMMWSWKLEGVGIQVKALTEAAPDAVMAGVNLSGHSMTRNKKEELHLDSQSLTLLAEEFPGIYGEMLHAHRGVQLKKGERHDGTPLMLFCKGKPQTMKALRDELNYENWLGSQKNAEKVIVALWYVETISDHIE